ncbi:hypothetical protein [Propioniciclava soli]|uniref:hypothetical protein n=1 Tax=Propioniciclava soli TaxID=2775081 RepID=UPI001E4C8850|nr:hypothetical protein [Propioniciclava soli]
MNRTLKTMIATFATLSLTLGVGVSTAVADGRSLPGVTCSSASATTSSRTLTGRSYVVTQSVQGFGGWYSQSWDVNYLSGPFVQTKNWGFRQILGGQVATPLNITIHAVESRC